MSLATEKIEEIWMYQSDFNFVMQVYIISDTVQGQDQNNHWFDGQHPSSMTLMLWLRWLIQHLKDSILLNLYPVLLM